jgi:hypothetical protein
VSAEEFQKLSKKLEAAAWASPTVLLPFLDGCRESLAVQERHLGDA